MTVFMAEKTLSTRTWSGERFTYLPRAKRPSWMMLTKNLLMTLSCEMLVMILWTEGFIAWKWFAEWKLWS